MHNQFKPAKFNRKAREPETLTQAVDMSEDDNTSKNKSKSGFLADEEYSDSDEDPPSEEQSH